MSIEEKRRAAFEAHIAAQQGISEKASGLWFSKYPNGCYKSGLVESLWRNWNAAMDSVVIELPASITTMAGPVFYAIDVRATIESAGLKVKP